MGKRPRDELVMAFKMHDKRYVTGLGATAPMIYYLGEKR
jgi:hypothetical protein